MKKSITIATFITKNEQDNEDFPSVVEFLKKDFDIEYLVFSDEAIVHNGIKADCRSSCSTKFKRLSTLMEMAESDIILCVDNDTIVDKEMLKAFLDEALEHEFALAWGKIDVQKTEGFVPNLIKIDKHLSHNILRPLLWKMNIGVSIPGQLFCINRKYFYDKLRNYDTVFDDLTLGIICRKYSLPVFISGRVIGYEMPKGSFSALIKQRRRWAKGFYETLGYSRKMGTQRFVVFHGLAYHQLWIALYLMIILLMRFRLYGLLAVLVSAVLLVLSKFRLSLIFYSLCYCLVFPVIHVIWTVELVRWIMRR